MLEKELIDRCKKQDRRAQQLLYEQYDKPMFLLCYRYVRDRHHAEDMLVSGFHKVFQNLQRFQHRGPGSLESWTRRILVNECLMFLRKNKRFQWTENENSLEQDNRQYADSQLKANDLLNLIRQLPDGYRTVFNLFAIEGFSHREISEKLGITEATSKSQLSKARAKIKKWMNQEENRHEKRIY